jgi:hypothetical protein
VVQLPKDVLPEQENCQEGGGAARKRRKKAVICLKTASFWQKKGHFSGFAVTD